MTDETPVPADNAEEPQLPPYVIEGARSGRSKCKTCRRAISKGALRVGFLVEGPYGIGYMWHHLNCAAKRHLPRVEEAYEEQAWNAAKEPPQKLPSIEELRQLQEKSEEKRKTRKEIPHAELAPSGRARCKQCGNIIEKDSVRVVLGRSVEFGSQVRLTPINIHPGCVVAALDEEDCGTESAGFAQALRDNSSELDAAQLDATLAAIGEVD